jgi:hypothetical protein
MEWLNLKGIGDIKKTKSICYLRLRMRTWEDFGKLQNLFYLRTSRKVQSMFILCLQSVGERKSFTPKKYASLPQPK